MIDEFEEIVFDEEIEEVYRLSQVSRLGFPAATFTDSKTGTCYCVYFNMASAKFVPDRIKWGVTTNYVVIMPAKETDKNSYPVRVCNTYGSGKQTTFPAALRNYNKLKSGTYKLYRHKNGLALKRYEPIEEETE